MENALGMMKGARKCCVQSIVYHGGRNVPGGHSFGRGLLKQEPLNSKHIFYHKNI